MLCMICHYAHNQRMFEYFDEIHWIIDGRKVFLSNNTEIYWPENDNQTAWLKLQYEQKSGKVVGYAHIL